MILIIKPWKRIGCYIIRKNMQCNCSCLGLFAGKEPIITIKQEIKEQTRKETFKRVVWLGEKSLWHHYMRRTSKRKM